ERDQEGFQATVCNESNDSTASSRSWRRTTGGEPVLDLEAQDIRDCDAVQVAAHLPDRQRIRRDEFVDGFTTQLPAVTKLRYRQPRWIGRHQAGRRAPGEAGRCWRTR